MGERSAIPMEATSALDADQSRAEGARLALILRDASQGSDEAWRALIDAYARRVFAMAKSRCRDIAAAEEITQSVFATIAVKITSGGYHEQGKFEPWLFRVAANRIRDHVRVLRRRHEHEQTGPLDSSQHPAVGEQPSAGVDADLRCRLRAALSQLPDSDREIIELRHHGGLSFKQIAEVLEEPLGTLLARHHRALKKLREILEPATGAATTKVNQ
jgi:RNA polymerase sigma-70 factor (ECF subfamily)